MSTTSESKAYLVTSFALMFFAMPTLAWNPEPEHVFMIAAGSFGLMVGAVILLIGGVSGLLREGVITIPPKPLIPLPGVILCAMAGVAVSFYIIDQAGWLGNMGLALWASMMGLGIGLFAGLYMAGLRIRRP